MKEPKNHDVASDEPDPVAAKATAAGTEEAGEALLRLHRDFLKAQSEIRERAQRRCSQAQADYMRAALEAQISGRDAQHEARQGYASAMRDATGQDDARQRAREAEERYVKDFESGQARTWQALEDASQKASAALQEANDAAEREREQTGVDYLKGIQDQFARLDAATASPEVLALVGQSLLWASTCVAKPNRG